MQVIEPYILALPLSCYYACSLSFYEEVISKENYAKIDDQISAGVLNPERYPDYSGPSATGIWDAVYSENCPKCELIPILNNSLNEMLFTMTVIQ